MAPDPERLQQLLDDFRIDELLSLVTLEEIADAWCRYQMHPHVDGVEDEDPDWWAVELLMTSELWSDEARLRTTLDLIIDRADEEGIFGVFAAGPLEDFAKDYNEDRLVWIEARAGASSRFRDALRRIWVWSLPPEVFGRIERAAGAPLPVPKERVEIDAVPGELPGTIQITKDGVVVDEVGRTRRRGRVRRFPQTHDRAVAQQAAAANRVGAQGVRRRS
ncbi:MAG TPA: hypothetical protein VGK69_07270 [Gaiellaceae bacterium]